MSRKKLKNFLKIFIDKSKLALYNYNHIKEKEMEKAKQAKKTRPTKKALIAQLEAKGVDRKITTSLMRANIETIQWVIAAIS